MARNSRGGRQGSAPPKAPGGLLGLTPAGSPTAGPPPAGWLQAYIDESPSRITGWLWDPQQPLLRISRWRDGDVRLMGDCRPLPQRPRAGIGDGHAFTVPLR